MRGTRQPIDLPDVEDRIIDLSSAAMSRRDYALYIGEMSTQLSRMANIGALPEEIGYCLDIAARAAQDWAVELDPPSQTSNHD